MLYAFQANLNAYLNLHNLAAFLYLQRKFVIALNRNYRIFLANFISFYIYRRHCMILFNLQVERTEMTQKKFQLTYVSKRKVYCTFCQRDVHTPCYFWLLFLIFSSFQMRTAFEYVLQLSILYLITHICHISVICTMRKATFYPSKNGQRNKINKA